MTEEKAISRMYEDCEDLLFNSQSELVRFLQNVCKEALAFLSVSEGDCVFKPEIKLHGDCTIFLVLLEQSGKFQKYKLFYREVKYEQLKFD